MDEPEGPTYWRAPSHFVFRRPLLPFKTLSDWSGGTDGSRAMLRDRLALLAADPVLREALYIASPGFLATLETWRNKPDSDAGRKIERALVRYLCRMASRAMGFGFFAALGIGAVQEQTQLRVSTRRELKRTTRLASGLLYALARGLAATPELAPRISFSPNPSLYRAHGELRFYAAERCGQDTQFQHVSLQLDPPLEAAVARARKEGCTREACARAVRSAVAGVSLATARAFVEDLIQTQLLVCDLEPALTSRDPLESLLKDLEALGAPTPLLAGAHRGLRELDARGLGLPLEQYAQLIGALGAPAAGFTPGVYADLYDPAAPTLDPGLVREAMEVGALFSQLAPTHDLGLDSLRTRVEERFGEEAVRLVDLFDPSSGMETEGQPPLDPASVAIPRALNLVFQGGRAATPAPPFERLLAARLSATLREPGSPLALTHQELLSALPTSPPPAPPRCTLQLSVFRPRGGGAAVVQFNQVTQRPLASILGRTAPLSSALEELFRAEVREEATLAPQTVPMEVLYLGHPDRAHLLGRPSLGSRELPLLGRSGLPRAEQIPLDDLWVQVREGRFILSSKALGAEVRPSMSNADIPQPTGTLAVYRFLTLVALQDARPGKFSWGSLEGLTYLPRVTLGLVVLSAARWNFGAHELKALTGARDPDADLFQRLRARWGLPRFIKTHLGENDLTVDLDNPLCVDSLAHEARVAQSLVVSECFPGDDLSWASEGPDGAYANEIFLPLVAAHGPRTTGPLVALPKKGPPKRYLPGSKWLYARIVASPGNCDRFLLEAVRPLLARAVKAGQLKSWHFLRYGSPVWHLRLRLLAARPSAVPKLLASLASVCERAMRRGTLERLELDTYAPEYQRYGGEEGLALAERWFEIDSEAALEALRELGADAHGLRFGVTVAGLLGILRAGGIAEDRLEGFLGERAEAFASEFSRPNLSERLGDLFRKQRAQVEAVLRGQPPAPEAVGALDVLRKRDLRLSPLGRRLQQLAQGQRLSCTPEEWLATQLHMHVNRMLCTHHRAQELALCELTARGLHSLAARAAKNPGR